MYCRNCGSYIPDESNFCNHCGAPVNENDFSKTSISRSKIYDGVIHKCPNCGEILDAFVTECPACGFELRGIGKTSVVNELSQKLEKATSDQQKKS